MSENGYIGNYNENNNKHNLRNGYIDSYNKIIGEMATSIIIATHRRNCYIDNYNNKTEKWLH